MKTGPVLQVTSQIVHDMMADPAFFAAVPVFYFLKDVAAAVVPQLAECGSCASGPMLRESLVRPFVSTAVRVYAENPQALRPLLDYLGRRLGKMPAKVVLPYAQDGKTNALALYPDGLSADTPVG